MPSSARVTVGSGDSRPRRLPCPSPSMTSTRCSRGSACRPRVRDRSSSRRASSSDSRSAIAAGEVVTSRAGTSPSSSRVLWQCGSHFTHSQSAARPSARTTPSGDVGRRVEGDQLHGHRHGQLAGGLPVTQHADHPEVAQVEGDRLVVQHGVAVAQVLGGLEADLVELVERPGVRVHRQLGRDRLVADPDPDDQMIGVGTATFPASGRRTGQVREITRRWMPPAGALLLGRRWCRGERAAAPRCSPGSAPGPRAAASSARSAGTRS